jgi:hypothetical protein
MVVLAASVLCISVSATAIGQGESADAGRDERASTVTAKKFKRLKRQVADLRQRLGALEGKPDPATPTSLPPSGPAGGSLTGNYPDPRIGAGAVGGTEIADDAVGAAEIAADAVGGPEIAAAAVAEPEIATDAVRRESIDNDAVGPNELDEFSVHASQLERAIAVQGTGVPIAPGASAEAIVNCTGRLLGGGFEWTGDTEGTSVIYSSPSFSPDAANTRWIVKGRVAFGAAGNTLFANALCLRP